MTELDEVKSENASLMGAAQGLGELCDKYKTENAELREMLSESRQTNERLYAELKRYKRIFRTRPIVMNALFDENDKLRDIAHKAWRLLLATGNDDLVLSIEANGVVKEVIDAEELAKAMQELGIEVDA